jgi:membrane-associated phospholipid phosphatase
MLLKISDIKDKIIQKNLYLYLYTFLYFIIMGVLYTYTNETVTAKYFMYIFIDDYIPFVKEMIIPYSIWYLYMIFPFIFFIHNSKEDFYKFSLFMFSGLIIANIIFLVFPNGQNLRPEITGDDILTKTILSIYSTDKPINSAPSVHVINSIIAHIALAKNKTMQKYKWIIRVSFILMISIILSTVMIKQHSILDAFLSIFICIVLYIIIYKINIIEKIKSSKAVKQSKK